MKSSVLHTLSYAAALATVCAVLLTGAAKVTAPYRKANEEAERKRNVLIALGVLGEGAPSDQVLEAFKANVRQVPGREIYEYVPAGTDAVKVIAVPFAPAGQRPYKGLWGPIRGFLAFDPQLRTLQGFSVYHHEETPGLGGEIEKEKFRRQFVGKSIRRPDGSYGITFKYGGGAAGPNEVDAISGATMTCKKVEAMLNEVIERVVKERGDGR